MLTSLQRWLFGFAGITLAVLAIYAYGRSDGVAATERKYQPILAKVEADRRAQERAMEEKEAGWVRQFSELEDSLAQQLSASREAQRASGGHIARLVSDITRCRIEQMRPTPADPSGTARASRITQRAREIITAIDGIGHAAKRDAIKLGTAVDTLRAERN